MVVLLVLVFAVCGVFWYLYRGELELRRAEEQNRLKEAVISEAEMVIMDFLDYGKEVSLATRGKYRGTVSLRMHKVDKNGDMGFLVSMYDSGDLTRLDDETRTRFHLENFVKKYGYYYDPERDSIVYQTSLGARLQPEERAELERRLIQRVKNHPMALIKSENVIGTRGI